MSLLARSSTRLAERTPLQIEEASLIELETTPCVLEPKCTRVRLSFPSILHPRRPLPLTEEKENFFPQR